MKLIRLEILNLASLDKKDGEVINFTEGALGDSTIFSIVGPTGSGKSTLLDAICLALYNRAPRYPKKKGGKDRIEIYGELDDQEKNRLTPSDCRNILSRGKRNGYSKLTFLANNGNVYRAEWHVRFNRTRYENAFTALYQISEREGMSEEKECSWEELPQIIGLDYEQFLRTVLIAQGSFANFLTAKESDRYELLEKLVGCEDTYSNIAARIKARTSEADKAFTDIESMCEAHDKDRIKDEGQLNALIERIALLEQEEKKAKEELGKLTEAIGWYSQEEKFTENIGKYRMALVAAQNVAEGFKAQAARLRLHDSTLQAVGLYKDIKTTEKEVDKDKAYLEVLTKQIGELTKQIEEGEQTLKSLQEAEAKAKEVLEVQKPHINKARTLKGELDAAVKSENEKKKAKKQAELADKEAKAAIAKNASDIKCASDKLKTAKKALEALTAEIQKKQDGLDAETNNKVSIYEAESKKAGGTDADKLQEAKAKADRTVNDIKEAIRILGERNSKTDAREQNLTEINKITERNKSITEELKKLTIDSLQSELETLRKTHTLMTSENWAHHRRSLRPGVPCPLCGSTDHPYSCDNALEPVLSELQELIDKKSGELTRQTTLQKSLLTEQGKNNGRLETLNSTNNTMQQELTKLKQELESVMTMHSDWSENLEKLQRIKPIAYSETKKADDALKNYNDLTKRIEKLRKDKEKAEKAALKYKEDSSKEIEKARGEATKADALLKTESGKTENLTAQQTEKANALTVATEEFNAAVRLAEEKRSALKAEIGDKNPDDFETELNDVIKKASDSVTKKQGGLGKLRETLRSNEGKKSSTADSMAAEEKKRDDANLNLSKWLENYNSGNQDSMLTVEDIEELYVSTDNWEDIRAKQKSINEGLTQAQTTLNIEEKAHSEHQGKKPEKSKETFSHTIQDELAELSARKAELENIDNKELTDCKARKQRHDSAVLALGSMKEKLDAAKQTKTNWDEIYDAIGSDGKTLRKIAQCYTLRFLIEHANVEIRKFNSRYELQQVKNSLGIRVIDHDRADDVRDTTSLSGGETFIISLGLALGLSALSSKNISFENLFIDEGFGTLDPDTLATVIDSLAMLQSSQGKKVGVISHTDTMSERISTLIRIIKDGNSGSSHVEIYP